MSPINTQSERPAQLEALALNAVYWQTPETFDHGHALFEAVCEHDRRAATLSLVSFACAL